MNAHIITIGDEILIGQTLNTNAAFIGEQLTNIQINISSTSVVGDVQESILKEFKRARKNNDVVVVTGGLGPTHDDVTRQCVVKFFETELVQNDEVLENIEKLFSKRNRKVTPVNKNQALVPKIAVPIQNGRGTAPGFWIEQQKKIFVVLPGVPYEMKAMIEDFVIPSLEEKLDDTKIYTARRILQTTGIPESYLYERLGNLDEILNGSKLAFLPNQFGVKMRITVEEENEEAAKNKLDEIEQKIRNKVGRFIFAQGEEAIEKVIAKLLIERGLKLSVAESCTGGMVSNMLTNISGSSAYFERGIIAYSNAAKVEILKVNEDTIAKYGSVSLEVARQMAEGIKAISGSDIGLSLTGIMGPTGATTDKPVGMVYIGYCDDKVCTAKKMIFGDDRLLNKGRASQAALDMLRRNLLGIADNE